MKIDHEGDARSGAVPPFDHRHGDRRECNLAATVTTGHGECRARIVDISQGGLSFSIDAMLKLRPGERFVMRQDVLREVRCIVRWRLHPRYGAAFEPAGRMPPGARAIYDSLGPGRGISG
jgi:hypothetical protein